ncbi:MAG: response regulator [Denitrovibrio sp.]|nr:MAG: response regulator [Denitrovibrio sp.]
MKILVVDDSAIARKFLIKSLPNVEGVEFEIKECINGLEAVNIYPDYKPDIVFLDLTMPVMDGVEALAKIKELDPDSVVYVLTADIQKSTQEKIMALDAKKFLKKPPSKGIIGDAVLEFVKTMNIG